MTINKRIRNRRKELLLSAEDLAQAIGKDRATIYRYESSAIENMPVSIIVPLAKALHCSPAYLMGWEDAPNVATEPTRLPDAEVLTISEDEKSLVSDYRKLNTIGKDKAREYISDLSENEKYTENLSGKLNEKAIG